jgi:hypothetical protein
MKARHLFVPSIVGLELLLALALCWVVGGERAPAAAAPPSKAALRVLRAEQRLDHASGALEGELHVCPAGPPTCDYDSIQEAVDAAPDEGIVKVAAGVYTDLHYRDSITQVVYLSKTLSIVGGYAIDNWTTPCAVANPTTVDAQELGRGFVISGDIGVALQNLHIINGNATGLGGGPWPYDGVGGGIYLISATASIDNCAIHHNLASSEGWGGGGGVYLYDSPSALILNTIYANTASMSSNNMGEGGGLALSQSDALLVGNTIQGNVANSTTANGIGGGLYTEAGESSLYSNLILDNVAGQLGWGGGGGVWFGLNDLSLLVNNVFVGNVSGAAAGSPGAGVASEWAYPRLVHTTIHDNTGGTGSGVEAFSSSSIVLTNTILVSQPVGLTVENGSDATVDGVLWFANGSNSGGTGNITVTSAFTGTPLFAADGYHLRFGSMAVETGLDAVVMTDIDGQTRPFGLDHDLGADELVVVTDTIDPFIGAMLTYTDTQGLSTTVQVPPGAVGQEIILAYAPVLSPMHPISPNLRFANHAFLLDAYKGFQPLPGFQFGKPVSITIRYSDNDIAGLDESTLRLDYWTGSVWEDARNTCTPLSQYVRDLAQNVLSVAICHPSEWSMGGAPVEKEFLIYLPLVLKNTM